MKITEYKKHGEFAWPGGYQTMAIMGDSDVMCFQCATNPENPVQDTDFEPGDDVGWQLTGVNIHWEGPAEICCHCNREIPSVCGDPEADEVD